MVEKLKDAAVPFLILLALSIKFGMVQAGASAPDFVKPSK